MGHVARPSLLAAGLGILLASCSAPGPGETVGTTASASTFPNDQPAFDYFVGKGLTPFQAAGIVGNLDQESGVEPTSVQGGGPGRGIAQWSVGGRWDTDANDNATSYASMEGQDLLSLQLQLDFIWYELTTFSGYGLAALQATTNVSDATLAFETDFEGCGTCDQSTRVSYAENVLATFGSSVDAGPVPTGDTGTPCTVTEAGVKVPPPHTTDAGNETHDSGAHASVIDAVAPGKTREADADVSADEDASVDGGGEPASTAGGCATSPAKGAGDGVWLLALAGLAAKRRNRDARATGQARPNAATAA